MALFKSKGIVLRNAKYRETSLIVDIYTLELGLRSYIVNGVRKAKSRMSASLFQHGTIIEMVAYDKEKSSLNRIKEIKASFIYQEIPYKIEKSSIIVFLIELIRNTVKEHESNESLYTFIEERLIFLDRSTEALSCYHIKFMIDLAAHVGFEPTGNYSNEKPFFDLEDGQFQSRNIKTSTLGKEKSNYLFQVMNQPIEKIGALKVPKVVRLEMIDDMIKYYRYHIEGFKELKSLSIYKQLF